MSLMKRMLQESLDEGSWIELYTDPTDLSRFSVGRLLAFGDEGYALQAIDRDGSWDPIHIGRFEDIVRASRNTPYVKMLASAERPPMPEPYFVIPEIDNCLERLIQEPHVVTIIDEDGETVHATVLELDDEEVLFTEISRDGETLGDEVRKIDSIRRLELNGPAQRSIERLLWSDQLRSL